MTPFLSFFRGQVLLVGIPSALESALRQGRLAHRHRFMGVPDGETAWQSAVISPPHVVLSRWSLPDMSAAVLCQRFKASVHHSHLRNVRFLAAMEPQNLQARLVAGSLGMDDVVGWPLDLEIVEMRLQNALTAAAQGEYLQKLSGRLQLTQALLSQMQSYDPEVGVFSRTALNLSLVNLLQSASPQSPIALLLLAMDGFDAIERQYGTGIAQAVLGAVAGRLQNQAAPHSLVYAFEASLLACLLPSSSPQVVQAFAKGLRDAIQVTPVAVQGLRLPLTLSVGIGLGVSPPPQEIVAKARQALAKAQDQGGAQICQL